MPRRLTTTALWVCILGAGSSRAVASVEPPCELQRAGGRPAPNDGLECGGSLVLLGDSKAELLRKCGAPLREERYCEYTACADLWLYKRDSGSFPREVRLVNDRVRAIRALSRFPP